MNFTIGIITSPGHHADVRPNNTDRVNLIIESILQLEIPNDKHEIIIIGDCNTIDVPNLRHYSFDETIKPGWITKKKNLITKYAQYENIAFLHDYVYFEPNWYKGFLKFGNDWDICMNVIKNEDNTRFRDWVIFDIDDSPNVQIHSYISEFAPPNRNIAPYLPEYGKGDTTKMYISGTYWVAKKSIMEKYPLNENLLWGQSEDIEWSQRIRNDCKYTMNPHSSVKLMKYKDSVWKSINPYHMSTEYINKKLV